jgi:C-terminal processing protease CtpA/Prc
MIKEKNGLVFCLYECIYRSFDPHTNYFSPQDKEDFDVSFKGKVIGIGATIQEKKGKINRNFGSRSASLEI